MLLPNSILPFQIAVCFAEVKISSVNDCVYRLMSNINGQAIPEIDRSLALNPQNSTLPRSAPSSPSPSDSLYYAADFQLNFSTSIFSRFL